MNIVFYIAHFIKEMTIDGYNKLREELPDNYKIVWIIDVSNYKGETRHYIDNQINKLKNNNIDIFVCDYSTIYKGLTIRYKSVINPQVFVFSYFDKYPMLYDYYWIVEYDVWFGGSWNDFINKIDTSDKTDFLASYFRCPQSNPQWSHWKYRNYFSDEIKKTKELGCCLSICRFSDKCIKILLSYIETHKHLCGGISELYIPTIINIHSDKLSIGAFDSCETDYHQLNQYNIGYDYCDNPSKNISCYELYQFNYESLNECLKEHPEFKNRLITRIKSTSKDHNEHEYTIWY